MNSRLFTILVFIFVQVTVFAEETVIDFEDQETGYPSDDFLIIDGSFEVAEHAGGKVLKLLPDPLVECGLVFGQSTKGAMTVEGRIFASKRGRRSFPRFGMGVHGISGHRIRVVPAQKQIELVHQEKVVATAPFAWKSDTWCFIKLSLTEAEGKPKIRAWVWMEGEEIPPEPVLTFEGEADGSSQGRATIWGTPYSGKEILFDDLKVTRSRSS